MRGASGVSAARAPVRRHLEALVEAGLAGAGACVVVVGEPGSGKTWLLDRACEWASALGAQVRRAAGDPLEATRPFGVVQSALGARSRPRGDLGALGELVAAVDRAAREGAPLERLPELRYRLADALVGEAEALGAAGPAVLAVDDLQWADDASLAVLARALPAAHGLPLVLLLAIRPPVAGAVRERLVAIAEERGAQRVHLEALGEEEVAALLAGALGGAPGPRLRAEAARTGGNPLLVLELAGALDREGRLARGATPGAPGEVELVGPLPVTGLEAVVRRRLTHLDAPARALVQQAAVLGTAFPIEELTALTGSSAVALAPGLTALLDEGLLAADGDRLAFRHDLVREVLDACTPQPLRAALHGQAAQALERADADPARVAAHLLRATDGADSAALLHRAARRIGPRDPAAAARLLARAVALAAAAGDDTAEAEADLVTALLWSGEVAEAERRAKPLLAGGRDGGLAARVRLDVGRAWVLGGRPRSGVEHFLRAAHDGAEPVRTQALAELGIARVLTGDAGQGRRDSGAALAAGTRLGDPVAVVTALTGLAIAAYARGRVGPAVQWARRAQRIAAGHDEAGVQRAQPQLIAGLMLLGADRLEDAGATLVAGLRRSEHLGLGLSLPAYHRALAAQRFALGAWDDALAEVAAARADALPGDAAGEGWASAAEARVLLHRDDLAGARHALGPWDGESEGRLPVEEGADRWLHALALVRHADGDLAGALRAARFGWRVNAVAGGHTHGVELGPDAVAIALQAGERVLADEVATAAARGARRAGTTGAHVAALRCRGLLDRDRALLGAAAAAARAAGRPLAHAQAVEDLAQATAPDGAARAAALALADEADTVYTGLGARRDRARIAALRRRLGVARGVRGPRARPARGWAALTDTEREVTRLVAEGLTNAGVAARMFLSRRTVETHVAHVLAKLEVASRRDLRDLVAARSPAGLGPRASGEGHEHHLRTG